jgi:hypothetical protein
MRVKIPFVGGSYAARSRSVDAQETINLYPENQNPDSKNVAAFIGTPGLRLFTVVTDSNGQPIQTPPRGTYITGQGRVFVVYFATLYEVYPSGLTVIRGSLSTTQGYVYMAASPFQMLITDATHGYGFDLTTNTLSPITDAVFPKNPGTVAYRDGFFVTHATNTNFVYASDLSSGTPNVFSWPFGNITPKETDSDPVVGIVSTATYLFVFGKRTTEIWYSTGNNGIGAPPFARAQEMVINVGCEAPSSIITNGNDVLWLGSNPAGGNVVWMANSYQPTRVSTHAEEYQIGQLTKTENAVAYAYQSEGHFFYVLNFPTDNRTTVYDITTGMWHRRGWWNTDAGQLEMHLALFAGSVGADVYAFDRRNANIYKFDLDTFTDNGDPIHRIRTFSHTHKDQKDIFCYGFELDIQKGVGLGNGTIGTSTTTTTSTTTSMGDSNELNDNPQMSLSWSKDGGNTWSKEHWASMGKTGKLKQRVQWAFGMGKSRDWTFRVASVAAVRHVYIAAYAELEVEPA